MSISRPWRGPNGSRHIGRVRIALAKYLTEQLGIAISPEDCIPATGAWRTDVRLDVHPWELMVNDGKNFANAGCWDSMTQFLKDCKRLGGCYIRDGELYPGKT